VTLGGHTLRDTICGTPLLAEDDTLPDGQEVIERDKDFVFVLLALAVHVKLPDRVDRKLVPLQFDLVRIRGKL
jgi:hypothetical protein